MNISGIRPSADFYSYNSIKINELRNQQIMESKKADQGNNDVNSDDNTKIQNDPQIDQSFSSFDYAKGYNPEETFEFKGVDSDIASLDIQKAVSDLDKDKVLQQYQFFVGDEAFTMQQKDSITSIAHSGENFLL